MQSTATTHQILSQKIEVDIERPLREFSAKSRDLQQMTTMQGNLAAMAKEIDLSQDKLEKLKKKGAKAQTSKVADAAGGLDTAMGEWNSQAPFVLEKLQEIDESRLNHLRDLLTQLQTHEMDRIERERSESEDCLNLLLNIQTSDEITRFAKRATGGKVNLEQRPSTNHGGSGLAALPTEREETASLRSAISGSNAGPSKSSGESRSGFGGLRRLGTVIKGKPKQPKRSSAIPYGAPAIAEKPSMDRLASPNRASRDAAPIIPSPRVSSTHLAPTLEIPEEETTNAEDSNSLYDLPNGKAKQKAVDPAPAANIESNTATQSSSEVNRIGFG
jgi:hypothetical protein